jgi:hypothetical protein
MYSLLYQTSYTIHMKCNKMKEMSKSCNCCHSQHKCYLWAQILMMDNHSNISSYLGTSMGSSFICKMCKWMLCWCKSYKGLDTLHTGWLKNLKYNLKDMMTNSLYRKERDNHQFHIECNRLRLTCNLNMMSHICHMYQWKCFQICQENMKIHKYCFIVCLEFQLNNKTYIQKDCFTSNSCMGNCIMSSMSIHSVANQYSTMHCQLS